MAIGWCKGCGSKVPEGQEKCALCQQSGKAFVGRTGGKKCIRCGRNISSQLMRCYECQHHRTYSSVMTTRYSYVKRK